MERFHTALHGSRIVLGMAVSMTLLPALAPSHAATSIRRPWDNFVPGEVLVKFKDSQLRAQSISRQAGQALQELEPAGLTHVKLRDDQAVEDAIAAYGQDANVEYAQPNYIYTVQAVPNDSLFGQLWGLQNTGQTVVKGQAPANPDPTHNPGTAGMDMNLAPAWDVITDCSSVIVGVVDTGLNYTHEDLAANLWSSTDAAYPNHGSDFVGSGGNDPLDLNGHGTHVSGTIGAVGNNGRGTTGVCWKAKLMALRACNTVGRCTSASEVAALNFGVRNNAKVINMSLGGPSMDQALSEAILSASNNDVVVVVAAGNEGANNDSTATYPCNFHLPNIICVAALDQAYALASFSNYGATTVHVGAPGVNVFSTWAGAETTIADNFHTAPLWTANPPASAWTYEQRPISGRTFDLMLDPSTFPNGTYHANADERVYKTFSLGPARVAVLDFLTQFTLASGDALNVNFRADGGDPFAGGTQALHATGSTSGRIIAPPEFDISSCITANCTVGFQLRSMTGPPPSGGGAAILAFQITTRQLNNVTYNVIEGTSMATPHVTGLAAMLRAYNPNYTVADVVNSIKSGGTTLASLAGKTTSGKAVNALGSLSYINAPTGVTAVVAH